MHAERVIRADFDADSIVVYQAFAPAIADAALAARRFVPPFSFGRMTWIKPSFLWLMHRSNWCQKARQERLLAARITRAGWEKALSLAVPSTFDRSASSKEWEAQMADAKVVVQWDPERSLHGAALPQRSIQVGVSWHIIREYVDEWIVAIEDYTPLVRKIHALLRAGHVDKAQRQLPPERIYPLGPELCRRLRMS
jgi:hypothetical protein